MSEQKATIDTRGLNVIPAGSGGPPKHFHSYPIRIGDMEGQISRETILEIQAHNRSIAAQNGSNGFAVVTDAHLGRWKFLIRDARLSRTFFGITYRCNSQEEAEKFGEDALRDLINFKVD